MFSLVGDTVHRDDCTAGDKQLDCYWLVILCQELIGRICVRIDECRVGKIRSVDVGEQVCEE